jgi:hypothetical protein
MVKYNFFNGIKNIREIIKKNKNNKKDKGKFN